MNWRLLLARMRTWVNCPHPSITTKNQRSSFVSWWRNPLSVSKTRCTNRTTIRLQQNTPSPHPHQQKATSQLASRDSNKSSLIATTTTTSRGRHLIRSWPKFWQRRARRSTMSSSSTPRGQARNVTNWKRSVRSDLWPWSMSQKSNQCSRSTKRKSIRRYEWWSRMNRDNAIGITSFTKMNQCFSSTMMQMMASSPRLTFTTSRQRKKLSQRYCSQKIKTSAKRTKTTPTVAVATEATVIELLSSCDVV